MKLVYSIRRPSVYWPILASLAATGAVVLFGPIRWLIVVALFDLIMLMVAAEAYEKTDKRSRSGQ
jgi:hypothetical protein